MVQKAELEKKRSKEREEKKQVKDLDKRRKKRTRDRDKALRDEAKRQAKRKRDSTDLDLLKDKRARASAIVKSYMIRTPKYHADDEYTKLSYNGVMAMPGKF